MDAIPKPSDFPSSLGIKNYNSRTQFFKFPDQWIEDKKLYDGAEDLWRVHDNLYDLTEFVDRHPGGKFWLEITKGADITEAFESYHLSLKAEQALEKHFVRKAVTPRNSPFTFKEDGFYKTLKRNVREIWGEIPKKDIDRTKHIIDFLFLSTIILIIVATKNLNYYIGFVAGIFLGFLNVSSHNYYHQKDTFRTFYSDIGWSPSREWKIVHIFSHHFHPNSVLDLQAYILEPLLQYFPQDKSIILKYASYVYVPFVLWPLLFIYIYASKLYNCIVRGHTKHLSKVDLLEWTIPTVVYFVTGQPILTVLRMFIFVIMVTGFWFCTVGLATTHYHPEIFIDGDTPRSENEMDWGINQLDTVGDRVEITGSHLFGLLMFGDHALHHLFPSLDHGLLNHLYPVVKKTLKQFNLNLRITETLDMFEGYFLQMSKEVANPNPPMLEINKKSLLR